MLRFRFDRSFYLQASETPYPSTLDAAVAVAYLRAPRSEGGRWSYICFRGKQAKPVSHFSARSQEQAEKAIQDFYAEEIRILEGKAQRAQSLKEARAKAKAEFQGVPGSVFVQSWGWEQTQVDAFQMIRRVGSDKIEVVEIDLVVIEGTGPMSDSVQPEPLSQEEAEQRPRLVMRISGVDDVLVPKTEGCSWGRHAHLWDGRRAYHRSWYA